MPNGGRASWSRIEVLDLPFLGGIVPVLIYRADTAEQAITLS